MPQFPEQFFAKKKNPKEQTESFPETKEEEEALKLIKEIKDLINKTEITPEDYQRITELCKEIKRLFSPERNPIGMKLIPNAEVDVERAIVSIDISPDGKFVVSTTVDGILRLARIIKDDQGNTIGMELNAEVEVEIGNELLSIDISPDGNFVAIGSYYHQKARLAKIIKDDQGNPIGIELIPNAKVEVKGGAWNIAISPDGNFVIIGSDDGKVILARIIKDSQGNPIGMELIPNAEVKVGGKVWSIAISPDGKFVVITSEDKKARLAKIIKDDQGNPIGMKLITNAKVEVGGGVVSIAISPDGKFVVITSEDGKVRLAKIIKDDQGNPIGMELIPDAVVEVIVGVWKIALSPDGNSVVIGSGGQKVRLAEIIFEEQE